jgi:hypothetical protein
MAAPKNTAGAVQVLDAKLPNVREFEFEAADAEAAASIGVVLAGSVDDRIARLIQAQNAVTRLRVEAGYLLLSIKAETEHGQFEARLGAMGVASQRASELMGIAKFVTQLEPEVRARMLKLDKTKLLALSKADAEVVRVLLEDGKTEIESLSYREVVKALGDERVRREKAENENRTLQDRFRDLNATEPGANLPKLISEARARIVFLSEHVYSVAVDLKKVHKTLTGLPEDSAAEAWFDPTLRLAAAACAHMQTQVEGCMRLFMQALPEGDYEPTADSALKPAEQKALAKRFEELVGVLSHQAHQRDVQMANATRTGPGRPLKVPQTPAKPPARKPRFNAKGRQ